MQSTASFNSEMPETLGPFRLVHKLGEGGMGAVYLGERMEQFKQRVAIKILYPQLFPDIAEASLTREADLLAALDHPGIVRMLDIGAASDKLHYDKLYYIVMEYVEGLPLDRFCDEHSLPTKRRIEILLDVFGAVEYAHRRLVVHADLKPENILVTAEGKPRLLDFGVASVVSEMGGLTASQGGFTAYYASPEQRAGERLTVASDVFSLGMIAHSLLIGTAPKPLALRSTRGDIDVILAKAIRSDAAQRFQSVQEMRDEFVRYIKGYPIQTRPSSRLNHAKKWVLRNRLIAGVAFMFLLALSASVAGVLYEAHKAANRRQIAQTRLHELVRMTDVLAGELYDSVHGLQGSEDAQIALLNSAHDTIHKLTINSGHDPQLELELARSYEKLARLELNRVPLSRKSFQQAAEDLRDEDELLLHLSRSNTEVIALQQNRVEMQRALQAASKHVVH